MDYEEIFVSHLPVIEKAIAPVCRWHHLPKMETEEFAAAIKLHGIEHDYNMLRRFRHRSSMPTYLIVVIRRQLLNHWNHIWGRWRL